MIWPRKRKPEKRNWIPINSKKKTTTMPIGLIQSKWKMISCKQNGKCRLYGDRDWIVNHVRANAANLRKRNAREDITVNGSRDYNLSIMINSTCKNKNISKKMRLIKLSGTLIYKQTSKSWPENKVLYKLTRRKQLSPGWFCCSSGQQSKNKRKWKNRLVLGSCPRAKKNCGTWRWQRYQF